jgi:hypothetical protein
MVEADLAAGQRMAAHAIHTSSNAEGSLRRGPRAPKRRLRAPGIKPVRSVLGAVDEVDQPVGDEDDAGLNT